MINDEIDIEHLRANRIFIVRKLAREISQHRDDPKELGFDIEEMQYHAIESPDPFVRALATRYLTRQHFGPH